MLFKPYFNLSQHFKAQFQSLAILSDLCICI